MGRTPPGQTRERVFRFVQERLSAGQPPTVREVQEAFGFRAVQTAREHLEALVTEGRLEKQPGKARGYRLPGPAVDPPRWVPLLGRVPAGAFETAVEYLDGYLPVQASLFDDEELFGLRVQGESMRDAGILPDDVVVVRRQPTADDGDIVVALVGDEATVKRLRRRGGRIELHPDNPAYDVLFPAPEEVQLLGRVIEVLRYLRR